ncbi:MAG: type II toxin-antitoxin system VapC family toxin [Dehalococcoidia bacterium]
MTRIYLDTCCLNRPFDDQEQHRIRLEAEALLTIVERLELGEWTWVTSALVDLEIGRIADDELRELVQLFAPSISSVVAIGEAIGRRGRELEALGLHAADALHLACAEAGEADVFLTTDDQVLRRAARVSEHLHVRVENPLRWIAEVLEP